MGDYYRHPDLRIRLNNPNEARIFLDDWRTWLPFKKPKAIPLWDGNEIPLNTQEMSDEQAVYAAFLKLGDMIDEALIECPRGPRGEQ